MTTRIDIPDGIRLVVLDMDGTIYRKPRMAWFMLCRQWRHLPWLIRERRTRAALRQRLQALDQPADPMAEKTTKPLAEKVDSGYAEWYRMSYLPSMVDIIAKHYTAQVWLAPMMQECRKKQIKVVILSDYEMVEDKLQALHLRPDDFDGVYSAAQAHTVKPDPALGTFLMQQLYSAVPLNGADKVQTAEKQAPHPSWDKVLFIGDRDDTDGALARALGAKFIPV